MQVRILGAHNSQSRTTGLISILVDGVVCVDAGSVTTALTLEEQRQVRALLLTHRHYDHIAGVATLGMNRAGTEAVAVFAPAEVLEELTAHVINGTLYPRFDERTSLGEATLALTAVEALRAFDAAGYRVVATPAPHGVPAVGYQVTGPDGASVFYTGDTMGGLDAAWEAVSPDLLIAEVTLPNRLRGTSKHMAAADLESELVRCKELKGALPRVLVVHMTPAHEEEIRREVAMVGQRLGVDVGLAEEGMTVEVLPGPSKGGVSPEAVEGLRAVVAAAEQKAALRMLRDLSGQFAEWGSGRLGTGELRRRIGDFHAATHQPARMSAQELVQRAARLLHGGQMGKDEVPEALRREVELQGEVWYGGTH
ncbi:MAG: MBL fold metallo-hydrolase [Dehalococcoidia bacterium]|nr:MBL fold metallo-hydrolase [Dehalococcoidia bacterium]